MNMKTRSFLLSASVVPGSNHDCSAVVKGGQGVRVARAWLHVGLSRSVHPPRNRPCLEGDAADIGTRLDQTLAVASAKHHQRVVCQRSRGMAEPRARALAGHIRLQAKGQTTTTAKETPLFFFFFLLFFFGTKAVQDMASVLRM